MKRIYIIAVVLLVSIMLAGCKCEHDWAEAGCITAKTCRECGETEGESLGHEWLDASCTAPRTCSRCGCTEGEMMAHNWKEANCISSKTCTECGVVEGHPLGHTWQDATRKTPKTCTRCGAYGAPSLSLEEAYPEGKLRYENGRFLMDTEDFLQLFLNDLTSEGYSFWDLGFYDYIADGYIKYYFMNGRGDLLHIAVVTDVDTDLIYMVSVGCEINAEDAVSDTDALDATNALLAAAELVIRTCHGALDEETENMLYSNEDYYVGETTNGTTIIYRYTLEDFCVLKAVSTATFEVIVTPDMAQSGVN